MNNNSSYFLEIDISDSKKAVEKINNLGLELAFDRIALNSLNEKGMEKSIFLVHENKVWGWDRDSTGLKDINLNDLFKILGISSGKNLAKYEIDQLLNFQNQDREYVKNHSINNLPDYRKNRIVCEEAIKADPLALKDIPDWHKTKEISQIVIDNTYGKNNKETNVFLWIPHEDLCLQAIKKEKDPDIVFDIVFSMEKELRSRTIALEAVSKKGMCLGLIPEENRTQKICEKAMEKDSHCINYVPENYRSPEMYLKALLTDEKLINTPKEIVNGENIYTFYSKIKPKVVDRLSFNQIKDLYNGKEIKIDKLYTANGIKENQTIRYNKEENKICFKDFRQKIFAKKPILKFSPGSKKNRNL